MLLEVHCDFPWVDLASHWNAVGAILHGHFPAGYRRSGAVLDAGETAGRHRGVARTRSDVYCDHRRDSAGERDPKSPEEWEKRALSTLVSGAPAHIWDNLEGDSVGRIGGAPDGVGGGKAGCSGSPRTSGSRSGPSGWRTGTTCRSGATLARRLYLSRMDAEQAMPMAPGGFPAP